MTVSLSGSASRYIKTGGLPHRLNLWAKIIGVVGVRLSFDPGVHNNRCLRPLLFDSTDADLFPSFLAHLP